MFYRSNIRAFYLHDKHAQKRQQVSPQSHSNRVQPHDRLDLKFSKNIVKREAETESAAIFLSEKVWVEFLDPIHSNLLMERKMMIRAKILAAMARVKKTRLDKLFQVISQVLQIMQSRFIHQ